MAASSSAREREPIHIRLSLDPQARAELERLATIDRRSLASAASLLSRRAYVPAHNRPAHLVRPRDG
jgi:hypothetical protein